MESSAGDSSPQVINRHHFKKTGLPAGAIYIGRGTPLGNPFTVQEHGADAALALYRRWLWQKIQAQDSAVLGALDEIGPATLLVCSCKPRPCHGDVVVRAWKWLRDHAQDRVSRH